MSRLLFFVLLIIAISSCNDSNNADDKNLTGDTTAKEVSASSDKGTIAVLEPKNFNPLSFIDMARASDTGAQIFFTMKDDFPENWVTKNYTDTLVKLIGSDQKCHCFLNPLSSPILHKDSIADVGGYALKFLKAYKNNEKVRFGLYACPKKNPKDILEIKKWWNSARAIQIQ